MNWGYKLLAGYLTFIGLMGYLVYRSVNTDFELVEKEYYKSELKYQEVIDGYNLTNTLSRDVLVNQQAQKIVISLPDEMKNKTITGSVWFYCAYDAKRDRKLNLTLTAEAAQEFDRKSFTAGAYTVKTEWTADGKTYYSQQPIIIE
jgi:hypothetical protein